MQVGDISGGSVLCTVEAPEASDFNAVFHGSDRCVVGVFSASSYNTV